VEKEKRAGGFWPKGHLPPPLWFRIERVREAGRDVAGRRILPASQAPAAVGQWGKTTRASRGTDSPTYLGRCWRAEAVPWAATDWKVASLARRCSGAQARGEGGRGGAWQSRERPAPFYRWSKAVRAGIFLSSRSFDGRQWRLGNIPLLTHRRRLGRDSRWIGCCWT
jgi:hypothetical protein